MPEYKRFVAYFYEYIDGKKQKNAGFAKVELRNGMWRVLFRLTVPVLPEAPARVYGFVRDRGRLREFLLGTKNNGCRGPEEWAWRAQTPVGMEKYYFDQLAGMRIQSGEGRMFLTVWDDEEVNPEQFAMEPEQLLKRADGMEPEQPSWSTEEMEPEQPSRSAQESEAEPPASREEVENRGHPNLIENEE
ncbi:MAG: hypothetical protein LIO94_03835, partial [Clostridiales bacterium]|nr:hypothetical protein [Clostridiales bacterium]